MYPVSASSCVRQLKQLGPPPLTPQERVHRGKSNVALLLGNLKILQRVPPSLDDAVKDEEDDGLRDTWDRVNVQALAPSREGQVDLADRPRPTQRLEAPVSFSIDRLRGVSMHVSSAATSSSVTLLARILSTPVKGEVNDAPVLPEPREDRPL